MKKKRIYVSAMMALLMAVSIAGCGQTKPAGTAPSSSAPAETSSASAAPEPASSSQAGSDSVKGSMEGVSVRIGTSGSFGPFTYYDTDGKTLIGYDIDMIKALQELLGFSIDGDAVQAMDYSALTTSLTTDKLDAVAAGLVATDKRKEVMKFTDGYWDAGLVVIVNKDNAQDITGVDSLAGKTVAVEKGTAAHEYVQSNLTDANIEIHDKITTAYQSLEDKKVDAVIELDTGAAFYLRTKPDSNLQIAGDRFNVGGVYYAIGISKDFEHADQLIAGFNELKANGTLDELADKWCK